MKSSITLITALILVAAWAGSARAQFGVYDSTDPFSNFERMETTGNAGVPGSSGLTPGPQGAAFRLPLALPMPKPLRLMPPKPVMVLRDDRKSDPTLTALATARREIVAEMQAEREAGRYRTVSTLLRKLETNRQRRLARLRIIADMVVPKGPVETEFPEAGESKPAPPVLPIPTLPKKN